VKARIAALIIMEVLASLHPALYAQPAGGSAQPLRLGYGPSIQLDPSLGLPVYTIHDELWVTLTLPGEATVHLLPPGSTIPVRSRTLEPGSPTRLYTFSRGDPTGIWSLALHAGEDRFVVRFLLLDPSGGAVSLALLDHRLMNGGLLVNLRAEMREAYDAEYCAVNEASAGRVLFPLPEPLGSGQLVIRFRGGEAIASVDGAVASPFTFWLTLHHPYSVAVGRGGPPRLVSVEFQVAESGRLLITPDSGGGNTSLVRAAPLRPGRYTLRAFFNSLGGLQVYETRALLTSPGRWIWLGACRPTPVPAPTFTAFTSLEGPVDLWPTHIYVMYRVWGAEDYVALPLNLRLARVSVLGMPWRVMLAELEATVAPSPSAEQVHYQGGAIYIIGREFPLELEYWIRLGERLVRWGRVRVERPFSEAAIHIQTGRLVVAVTLNGEPVAEALVKVRGEAGGVASKPTDAGGQALFHLPGGRYTVQVSWGAEAREATVAVKEGETALVHLDLAPDPATQYLIWGLTGAALLGIALNIWVWVLRPRARPWAGSSFSKPSSFKPSPQPDAVWV